ncbi:uncharacterized protein LOC108864797 [Galendromus occidentalis]|uniref:Uncharacterized protein LOC108864797 n=1 Tax=Galendromus occidentalis TaxID=34638 RepID=A0AAJ7L7S7_9ACAR|nr:uncharacterized protein LOC108864797 [Galendromus occidentalis]
MEAEVEGWLLAKRAKNRAVMIRDIQGKALRVVREFGDMSSKASNEWARRFLKRNEFISVRRPTSVGQPVAEEHLGKIESHRRFYSETSDIDLSNIGNFVEVPVLSDIVYGRSVAPKGSDSAEIDTTGNVKNTISIVLCVTAVGDELPSMPMFKKKLIPGEDISL